MMSGSLELHALLEKRFTRCMLPNEGLSCYICMANQNPTLTLFLIQPHIVSFILYSLRSKI